MNFTHKKRISHRCAVDSARNLHRQRLSIAEVAIIAQTVGHFELSARIQCLTAGLAIATGKHALMLRDGDALFKRRVRACKRLNVRIPSIFLSSPLITTYSCANSKPSRITSRVFIGHAHCAYSHDRVKIIGVQRGRVPFIR